MANNIYFNSRAKAKEAKLLSLENLKLLANSKTPEEVSKLLNNFLMLKGTSAKTFSDFLQIVLREQEDFLKFLKMETPNKDITKFFCLKFDYFNLEALFLQQKLGKSFNLLPEGTFLIETLKKAVQNKDERKKLSFQMQKVLYFADELINKQNFTGFLIDTAFKKAQYNEMLDISKCDKTLYSFFNSFIDLKNIELCFRFRDKKIFEQTRLLGGTLETKFFEMLCEKPLENILASVKNSPYFLAIKLIVESASEGKPFSKFEFLMDCFGETFFDEFKFTTGKYYAYIRYCFKKQNEITNLRIIFEGLQAGRSHKKICDDLRRIYAE